MAEGAPSSVQMAFIMFTEGLSLPQKVHALVLFTHSALDTPYQQQPSERGERGKLILKRDNLRELDYKLEFIRRP